MEAKTLKFTDRFSRSITCEMLTPDVPPERGKGLTLLHQWTGRPKKKHLAAYRQWTIYSVQILATRWQKRILYALGIASDKAEIWCFEPGGSPRLLETIPVGLPCDEIEKVHRGWE